MKKYDVVALGELLIDFIECGESLQGNPLYEANPGGAPCNVLAMLNKMQHKTAFIGKVGDDFFGDQLRKAIREVGVDDVALLKDQKVHTTLAMVHKKEDGDREFSFYRNPGADMMLSEREIPEDMIKNSNIFHFGTVSMTHKKNRKATKYAVSVAKESGVIISFDPNLRFALWEDQRKLRECVLWGIKQCDILKISDDEIQWLTGLEDYSEGVKWIRKKHKVSLILVSMGKGGSRAYYRSKMIEVKAHIRDDSVEMTGAGDTFMGSVLHFIMEKGLDNLSDETIKEMLCFANCAASLVTTKKGALRVMPTVEEVKKEIKLFGEGCVLV